MSPPEGRVPVEGIRHAARVAVESRSLRSVAADVGMSPTGLRHFLNGRSPYSATLRKLNAWYVRHAATRHGSPEDAARAAVAVLAETMPEAERAAFVAEVLDFVRGLYRRRNVAPPAWMDRLRPDE